MLGYDEELELIKDDVKVTLINIGEGHCGDYNENDPDDENLLRFEVNVYEHGKWIYVEDSSYCTYITADTSKDDLNKVLHRLMKAFYNVLHNNHSQSVKKLGEEMSWISL